MIDPIAILEAAYSLVEDEQGWLTQFGETARKNSKADRWFVATTYDATRPDAVTRATAYCGLDERVALANTAGVFRSVADQTHIPMFHKGFVGTLTQAPACARLAGVDEARVGQLERDIEQLLRETGLADEVWVNALDPTGMGCCFAAPLLRRGPLHPREVHQWSCLAAHVATAFRIRRQFAQRAPLTADAAARSPEAILDPDGKLEHAAEPAQGDAARAALRESVLALDRARGPLRRRDPDQAIAIWQALVAGRWSLLDHFDSDGRRFIVAHRNDASVPDARGLTLRERQVIAYAALGHSNKVIAYELGLSTSTVGSHLARARAKLPLPLRTAIV
jgi:DNA-binding CsgD family transcriptional regulator